MDINSTFNSFQKLNAVVIGDSMIDAYFYGNISRQSPEADVPIVQVSKREQRLGGAANVALNLSALGMKVNLISTIGDDNNGSLFNQLLKRSNLSSDGIVKAKDRPTTTKTRVFNNSSHVIRVDEENTHSISSKTENQCLEILKSKIKVADVLIIQDYNKGLLTPTLIKSAIQEAKSNGVPVAVDPKRDNFLLYQNVDLFKPNRKEVLDALELTEDSDFNQACIDLRIKLNAKGLLVTLSEKGAQIYLKDGTQKVDAHVRNIIDVSGAGDTVISVASALLAAKTDWKTILEISNLSGGLVCEKLGVVTLDLNQLKREAESLMT